MGPPGPPGPPGPLAALDVEVGARGDELRQIVIQTWTSLGLFGSSPGPGGVRDDGRLRIQTVQRPTGTTA